MHDGFVLKRETPLVLFRKNHDILVLCFPFKIDGNIEQQLKHFAALLDSAVEREWL